MNGRWCGTSLSDRAGTRQPLENAPLFPKRAAAAPTALVSELAMLLQFHRPVEKMEIWIANSDDYSFVISYESPAGPGFHGRAGYIASWRTVFEGRGAIRITGSPFKTFDEAEAACDAMLTLLVSEK